MPTIKEMIEFLQKAPKQFENCQYLDDFICEGFDNFIVVHYSNKDYAWKNTADNRSFLKIGNYDYNYVVVEISEDGKEAWLEMVKRKD